MSLVSTDMNFFNLFVSLVMVGLTGPVSTIIIIYIMWTFIGHPAFAGLVIIVLLLPFQGK